MTRKAGGMMVAGVLFLAVVVVIGAGVVTTVRTRRNQLRNGTRGINGSLTLAIVAGLVASFVAVLVVGGLLFFVMALVLGGPRLPGGFIWM